MQDRVVWLILMLNIILIARLRFSWESHLSVKSEHNTWHTILKNYPIVNVIFFNETHYFNGTALANSYNHKYWKKSPQKGVHLSEFTRLIWLFRCGGLFIDMGTVVTLKPLNEKKWWNSFVKNSLLTHTLVGPASIKSNVSSLRTSLERFSSLKYGSGKL